MIYTLQGEVSDEELRLYEMKRRVRRTIEVESDKTLFMELVLRHQGKIIDTQTEFSLM